MNPVFLVFLVIWFVLVPMGFMYDQIRYLRRQVRTLQNDLSSARMDVQALERVAIHAAAQEQDPECACGAFIAGRAKGCPLHPGVRLRTTAEKAAFARAFDQRIQGDTK